MATSLLDQLLGLKTPQTDLLVQDKKRPSLLFDPKEAANLDRHIVLSIGQSGLEDLVKLSPLFADFKSTLFSEASLGFERATQDAAINKRVDTDIAKFMILLSPYFLLNASHKALEWLIYRYHIHKHNRDQFILLILPYHESRIFARALQLLNLSDKGNKWHWLISLQKCGQSRISEILVSRLCKDDIFLKMLCTHVISAMETYSDQASCLTTLYTFYTTLMLTMINQATTITDVQMDHIISTLFYGLRSSISDLAVSSYFIVTYLMSKVKLDDDRVKKILLKTFKKTHLKQEAIIFLVNLYQTPINRVTVMSRSVVLRLSNLSWFIETIFQIHSTHTNVSQFAVPFLQAGCQAIVKDPDGTINVQNMMHNFLTHVKLDDDAVDVILSNVLTCNFFNSEMLKNAKIFIAQFYQSFERSYPDRFDKYLKDLMKKDEDERDSKEALNFLTSWPFVTKETQESVEVLDRLAHINSVQRMRGLEILAKDNVSVPKSFRGMMTRTLQARFYDSEVNVVKSLLSLSTKKLTSLLPTDTLVDDLVALLSTCHTASKKDLAKPALKILLELCEDGNDTRVFITSLPYLFPATEEDMAVAMEVLCSNFAKNNIYMLFMMKDLTKTKLTAEAITSTAFHNILNYSLLPATNSILNTMRQQISHGDAASLFFNMILLGSVCRVPVGSMPANVARDVIEMATEMIKKYPRIKLLHDCNIITGDNIQAALKLTSEGTLPLQVGTYVLEMVHRRLNLKSEPKLDFVDNAEQSNLIVRLLEMFFEGMDNKHWKKHYFRCLQIFFQRHFDTIKNLISFLSQLYIRPVRVETSYQCLQITLKLLDQCSIQWVFQDQHFVTNLMLSLARPNNVCRSAAIDILKKLTQTFSLATEPFFALLQEVAARSTEIAQDSDQLSIILYYILSPDPDVCRLMKQRKKLQQAQKLLFDVVLQEDVPIDRRSELLDVLTYVNSTEILQRLAPLGLQLLKKLAHESTRSRPAGNALRNILQRFTDSTVEALNDSQVWSFFEKSILQYDFYAVTESGQQTSPSIVLLKQINKLFFQHAGKVSRDLQVKIFSKMLDVLTDCEVSSVISNVTRAIRTISIDAKLVVSELQAMKLNRPEERPKTMESAKKKPKRHSHIGSRLWPTPKMVYSKAWKRGETLLQIVQHANNIEHEETLYGVLFDLVNVCVSLEELSPVEYTNQLILQTIYRLMTQNLPLHNAHLHISLITKCIRTSRNPQTHHHALLVLIELLKKVDVNRALINIMPIFTFMGSTVVRQDDSYSIQITSKVLDTVIPIVNAANNEIHACMMLRIFVASLPDIPEHRRTQLFVQLLQLLDNYLHLYYLLTFESHAIKLNAKLANDKRSMERLEFALQVCQEFPLKRLLSVCVRIIQFIRILPVDIEEERDKLMTKNFQYKHVYDVSTSSPKALRHYKLTAVQFLSSLLSSDDFINRLAKLNADEADEMNKYCDCLGAELITLVQTISKLADQQQNKPSAKYWKVLLHYLYDVLDLVNNLLPNTMFLKNVKRLQNYELLSVKKKMLEMLNTRLLQKKFGEEDHEDLLNLIEYLISFVNAEEKVDSQEYEIVQQTALNSLKLLGKLLATDHPNVFMPILYVTTELLQSKDGPVLASAALCVAELICSMKTQALDLLNTFVPVILKLLKTHCRQNVPDVIAISIVSALQKVVEFLANFLSPYLNKLLFELTRLNTLYIDKEHPKTGVVISRLKTITQKLSSCISPRVLLPAVNKTYQKLLNKKCYTRIPSLISVLADSFENVSLAELNVAIPNLSEFFLKVLQFREDIEDKDDKMDVDGTSMDVVAVEESAGKALVALVLKLSEATFRPLYTDFYKWTEKSAKHKYRNITFYRLSAKIAECLKSLFALFADLFLKHAALLLKSNNTFVNDTLHELTLPEEWSRIELVEAILLTLHHVFSYDAHNFVSQERFEILAQPIVDQIENTMGTKEEYESRASKLIVPCIASFASAIPDDALHKQLVYQMLLKTKHVKPYVRSTALNALVEIARKLGEDFMPLLPETVPFLAEILEDEDEATEKCAQNAVCTLEEILGEPLRKYF